MPAAGAHAARGCEEWSAAVSAVEGTVEVRRSQTTVWTKLAAGDRVCTGDLVQAGGSSRATLVLPDGGVIRVDADTVLNLPEPPAGGSLVELLRGLIHIISRDPRSLTFRTPYANAGLEGTEFDIRVDDTERFTEIVVLEGEVVVTAPAGALHVPRNHVAVAREGLAPAASPIERPIDRMRWASHYPPLLAGPLPAPEQEPSPTQAADPEFYTRRAAARLATARIPAAEADLATALRLAPRNATALSLDALLALARADRATARARLADALAGDPASVVARLTLSHVEESEGALTAARRAAREAVALEPENAIALTRLAELALAEGDTAAALASAERARALAPEQSTPLVVLGFASLRAFRTADAERAFSAAVDLEPDAPLPRLGLALASIRRGDRTEGRRQLELAVALNPPSALLRSYMAKLYAALNRSDLTATQLDLAMEFDPADPTPWLYSALEKLRTNRPVEALREVRLAARKNDDRPVFRSRLPLDDDFATGSAGLGRLYAELGFGRLAMLDAWHAIGSDPTSFAGHRLLADAYSMEPRHEIARVSELLVSQLLQPANVAPLKPQLGQQNLFIAQRLGPSAASFDELGSPLAVNGLKLRASAVTGGNGVHGDDVSLAGLSDKLSFNVGHYRFATDGFRTNNDFEQEVVSTFLQYRPAHDTSLQLELRSARTEFGDFTVLFDRDLYSPSMRTNENVDSIRVGARHQLTPTHTFLGSVIYQDALLDTTDADVFALRTKQRAYHVDAQHLYRSHTLTIQSGMLAARQDENVDSVFFLPGLGPLVATENGVGRQIGAYAYAHIMPIPSLMVTAGVSLDTIDNFSTAKEAANPKFGIAWRPTGNMTVRFAAFETLFGSLSTSPNNAEPRLEPVQVAGFTQLLVGGAADQGAVRGLSVEREVSREMFVGWRSQTRDTTRTAIAPLVDAGTREVDLRERTHEVYMYWTPAERLSISARYERARYSAAPVEFLGYSHVKTARLPIDVRYFSRIGITAGVRASHARQEGLFQLEPPLSPFDPPTLTFAQDRFWVVDAFVGYRLPNRRGLLSLNADNLFDEEFRFQDIDPTNPSLFPERLVSFRFTLAFE